MWNKRRCWFEPQSKSVKQLCLYSGVFKFVIWSNFWSVSVCLLWIYGNSISHNCHHCILRFNHLLGVCCPFASVAKKKAQKIQFDQFFNLYCSGLFSCVFVLVCWLSAKCSYHVQKLWVLHYEYCSCVYLLVLGFDIPTKLTY